VGLAEVLMQPVRFLAARPAARISWVQLTKKVWTLISG
jgi:hypothetical protein